MLNAECGMLNQWAIRNAQGSINFQWPMANGQWAMLKA
jgi:hypothetical protein